MENGEIEFLGRVDDQLKIRGFRIEPGEIENAVLQLPGIMESLVTALPDNEGNNELVCYYVGGDPVNHKDIRDHLGRLLPEHMIPSHFVALVAMPLNENGKISKKDLPPPGMSQQESEEEYIVPGNTIEEQLAAIWSEVLDKPRIGINDNFFNLGGNSLKIVRLYDLIQKTIAEQIKVSDLFDNPTIAKQAAIISVRTGKLPEKAGKVDLIDF